MSTTTDLLNGIAGMIAGAGLGVTFSPTAVYTAGQTGVFMKFTPTTPSRVVVLTAVYQGDQIEAAHGQIMVQVLGRGVPNNPTDVDDLLDSIFPILHGATYLTFGSLVVEQVLRKVSVPMGMDSTSRWSRVDQYYLDVTFPSSALRP